MANVTLFDTNTGTYSKVTIKVSNSLLAFLASKGYTVISSNPA